MIGRSRADPVAAAPDRPTVDAPRPTGDAAGYLPVPAYPARTDISQPQTAAPPGTPHGATAGSTAGRVAGDVLALLRRSTPGKPAVEPAVEPAGAGPGKAVTSPITIRRYFDTWPASEDEAPRKARFDAIVDNAVAAGISKDVAEAAGLVVLQKWGGWSSHYTDNFDYAWVTGFRTALAGQLVEDGAAENTLKPLLDGVFAPDADPTELARLGRAAGFDPDGGQPAQQLDLNPQWESEIIGHFANRFETRGDWKGQGAGFRAAWAHATVPEKHRVLVILLGPNWQTDEEHFQNPHLSDLSYLIEGVTGITPSTPDDIKRWVRNPQGSLFGYMRNQPGYKTKYMSEREREEYRLTIADGHVHRSDGKPLVGDNIFVLSLDGVFYGGSKLSGRNSSKSEDSDAIHHSSFMAGAPVSCAGHLITDPSGLLTAISDQSGHYAPTDDEFGAFLYRLKHDLGVDLENISFRRDSAEAFLLAWEHENIPGEPLVHDEPEHSPDRSSEDDPFDENDIFKNPFG